MDYTDLADHPGLKLPFGCHIGESGTTFRLYAPEAEAAECLVYPGPDTENPEIHPMNRDGAGIWDLTIPDDMTDSWYRYRLSWPDGRTPDTPYADQPFADPWSHYVAVRNSYRQEAISYIYRDDFDWEGDRFIQTSDQRDLIICEAHFKDLVAHPVLGAEGECVSEKWLDEGHRGGLTYLKQLGINAVEFLPLQKFPYEEPPYREKTEEGFHNTWNPDAINYWGYMTSFFMAPETRYSRTPDDHPADAAKVIVRTARELKQLIKRLHANGIAVIMDIVFNHTSLFDINPLGHHLKSIYLRRDERGALMNRSGTGNEMQTEHPVVRKLILDTLTWWMKEYHVDGFRFDLAGLIDERSWDPILETIRQINPSAPVIAEPWGGRYVPWLFSNHGWSSWNDRFRNGIKGSSPHDDRGFIFSSWHHGSDRKQLENWFRATLRSYEGGLFQNSSHAVNYLESHDGYTLGDFIRIVMRYNGDNPVVEERTHHVRLNIDELKVAQLAALCLMVSQGVVMLQAGQDFARTRIIAAKGHQVPDAGRMDHNSYNKDDETNWINFDDLTLNAPLSHYYRGLIQIRHQSPALRKSAPEAIRFDHVSDPLFLCIHIDGGSAEDLHDYYIALNGNSGRELELTLPEGYWELLADNELASSSSIDFISGPYRVPSSSGVLLRRLRH